MTQLIRSFIDDNFDLTAALVAADWFSENDMEEYATWIRESVDTFTGKSNPSPKSQVRIDSISPSEIRQAVESWHINLLSSKRNNKLYTIHDLYNNGLYRILYVKPHGENWLHYEATERPIVFTPDAARNIPDPPNYTRVRMDDLTKINPSNVPDSIYLALWQWYIARAGSGIFRLK